MDQRRKGAAYRTSEEVSSGRKIADFAGTKRKVVIPMLDFAALFQKKEKYPHSLLDIGCGPCLEGEQLLARGITLTGIDQDGETIGKVQERLPEGKFITADAAFWLDKTQNRYDAILVRRPDLIFRSENWKRVFELLPSVLKPGGSVIVTTPGQSEATMCAKWLRNAAENVRMILTGISEESFMVKADHFKKVEKQDNSKNKLIQELSWEDDQPALVCDLRTGRCTVFTNKEDE
jgi:trans-aconitate methyltransferase